MARIDDLFREALRSLGQRPAEKANQAVKKGYSEKMSAAVAHALGDELRHRGMRGALPAPPGEVSLSGADRRLAGGIGPKKVDVAWATHESGLLLATSITTINWRDERSQNFQKNLANRCNDMLLPTVSLHRRFPYSVLTGLLFLDKDAEHDGTDRRRPTFDNAVARLRLYTNRADPGGRDEQFERMYVVLVDANPFTPSWRNYHVGDAGTEVATSDMLDDWVGLVVERNPDFYESDGAGRLRRIA